MKTGISLAWLLLFFVLLAGCAPLPELAGNNSLEQKKVWERETANGTGAGEEAGVLSKEIRPLVRPRAALVISPSAGEKAGGAVTITLTGAPAGTNFVDFYLEEGEAPDVHDGPPNLGSDDEQSDGWSLTLDTAIYDNGKYTIFAFAYAEEPGPSAEPLEMAKTFTVIDNPPLAYRRNYPLVIKGNWEPSTEQMNQILNSEVDALKALGVNTVSIVLEYNLNPDGSYYLEAGDDIYITQLRRAKQAGFAVLVSPNFVGAAGHNYAEEGIAINLEKHLQNSEEVALKWAAIAEKYQAEFFAPQNEFNGPIRGNFAGSGEEEARITTAWHREMRPKLKEVFSGRLMAKLDNPVEGIDVSGYDYVGMTISHGNGPMEGVRRWLTESFVILKEIGENSNAEWLVSEAWFPYGGPWYGATENEDGESLDELQDDYYRMSLEEYDKAGGKDYIFIAWLMPGMDIKGRPAEKVIKDYFKKI